jgi:hypothetical protein
VVSTQAVRLGAISAVAIFGFGAAVFAWHARRSMPAEPHVEEMAIVAERFRAVDAVRRLKADFAHLPTWDELGGPDPYVVARVPESPHLVGILRGDDAVVVLDEGLRELQRVPAPAAPVAIAVADDGAVFVAGELATHVARFSWQGGKLVPSGKWQLDDIRAVRGIAAGTGGFIYVAEERDGRLLALRLERGGVESQEGAIDRIMERREIGSCHGPIRLLRVADRLIADCVLDHRLVVHRLESSGAPSSEPAVAIVHDGPIWSFDALTSKEGLLVAAGGVEDHPLDRTIGAFGYIDSFLFLYRLDGKSPEARREAAINLSELGVVTPKAIMLRDGPPAVIVTGYGSDQLLDLTFSQGPTKRPVIRTDSFVPGTNAVTALHGVAPGQALVFANPLLDAWILSRPGTAPVIVPVAAAREGHRVELAVRLGEALFFTTLMAPWSRAEGPLSRFTCETCHYEGYVDGRTHHTGRDDVHAVTKPLLGLFNNRPHFSRALDPDLTAVVFNEFRVAGAKSGHDPWFSLDASDAPWVGFLGSDAATLTAEEMRKALMSFLIAFQHRPNPSVLDRAAFSDLERQGAALFRDRCENCHEARLSSDEASSRVAFERWESLVMSRQGPIVWGTDVYAQTGIVPYVHEKGARVPSLRRLYKKQPYFTNGAGKNLEDVLVRARLVPSGFQHDARSGVPPAAPSLDGPSRAALLAFMQLL